MPYITTQEFAKAQKQLDKARMAYCAMCEQETPHLKPKHFPRLIYRAHDGRVCLMCGWMHVHRPIKNKRLRKQVYEADNYQCVYCGRSDRLGLDHVIPQSRGGTDTFDNLLTACHWCNALKCDGRADLAPRYGRFA